MHIWGPVSPKLSLRTRLMRYLSPPLLPVGLRELPSEIQLHEVPVDDMHIGEFRIDASLVCHPGSTVGYRITDSRGKVIDTRDASRKSGPGVSVAANHSRAMAARTWR